MYCYVNKRICVGLNNEKDIIVIIACDFFVFESGLYINLDSHNTL